MTSAIDCLVNVDMGDLKQPEWMIRVKEDYFKAATHRSSRAPSCPS